MPRTMTQVKHKGNMRNVHADALANLCLTKRKVYGSKSASSCDNSRVQTAIDGIYANNLFKVPTIDSKSNVFSNWTVMISIRKKNIY